MHVQLRAATFTYTRHEVTQLHFLSLTFFRDDFSQVFSGGFLPLGGAGAAGGVVLGPARGAQTLKFSLLRWLSSQASAAPIRDNMLVAETDALRVDLAAMLRHVAGETSDAAAGGCESAVAAFTARAVRLQQAFAAVRLRTLTEEADGTCAEFVREEVATLQRELAAKDALLATHRERVCRWQAECEDVRAGAANLSEVALPDSGLDASALARQQLERQPDDPMDGEEDDREEEDPADDDDGEGDLDEFD